MSMESVASVDMSYRAVRRRLWNPPNGRVSEHTEVVSDPLLRQQRVDAAFERGRMAEKAKLDAQAARLEEFKIGYATALARRADIASDEKRTRAPYIQQIVAEVCRRYSVTTVDIRSHRRTAKIVLPRQIIMYLARTLTNMSLPRIGQQMGKKDHTTVLHAVTKVARLIQISPELAAEIADITATIAARQAQREAG